MYAIAHIVFAYLHFAPGPNGGWVRGTDYPRYSDTERATVRLPFEGYWERLS